ncbi:MAG: hypothetical protein B6244_00375 [Candidatus Cloacimonetes bacterium 4572_55]|nr:MAG: hypothetical protein B6244_00375 [Candidatus Cloacimonetes bacterium 4572_55]
MKPTHYHFILNPASRGGRGARAFFGIEDRYLKGSIPYTLHVPSSVEETLTLSRELADAHTVIIAAGGDGTVNTVATGLVQSGSPAVMGILPLGTGNALSYTCGVRKIEKAVETLFSGSIYAMDLIKTNNKTISYVTFMAGVGFDGKVLAIRNQISLGGFLSFPIAMLVTMLKDIGNPKSTISVAINGRNVLRAEKISSAVISNGHCYGFGFPAVPRAYLDDGQIELQLFPTKRSQFSAMAQYGLGWKYYPPSVERFSAESIEIQGERAGQFDGEVINQKVYSLELKPQSLRILAADGRFFSKPPLDQIRL